MFSGYDLVEWLMVRLQLSDPNEALHLATLLCQCGYYFPVSETKSLAVRDDGTLFRFQVNKHLCFLASLHACDTFAEPVLLAVTELGAE